MHGHNDYACYEKHTVATERPHAHGRNEELFTIKHGGGPLGSTWVKLGSNGCI